MDKLYECSTTYEKLRKDISFELKIDSADKSSGKIVLTFPQKRFRHICGVEKLSGIGSIFTDKNPDKAKQFYNEVIAQQITENDLKRSPQFTDTLSEKNEIRYFIEDRPDNIANLYDYLHNSKDYLQNKDDTNISIYSWKLNARPEDRPENSQIPADLMICFSDSFNKKTDDEKSYIWFQDTGRVMPAALSS